MSPFSNDDQVGGDSDRTAKDSTSIRTDGGTTEKREPRQIGPRIDPDLADDFEMVVRHLHNGKYKGRLSDEVENAFKLHMGQVVNDNPKWIKDVSDEDQRERFKTYAERFQNACSSAPMDSEVAGELSDLRQEIEAVNATSTNMLSQILTQISDDNDSSSSS